MTDQETQEQMAARIAAEEEAARASTKVDAAPDILAAYNNVLAEKDRQVRDALAEVERMKAERNAPPPLTPEESAKKFFENPVDLIRSEIQNALKPITETISSFATKDRYSTLKAEMVLDSRFVDLPKIEKEFDTLMRGQPIEPNAMIGAYYAAYGMVASNDPKRIMKGAADDSTTTPPKKVDNSMLPPHLRPSTPNAPITTKGPEIKRPPLTENERLLMKLNKIATEEEWYALMDARPDTVTTTKVEAK